jgi:biopolymer transport protein ExbB
MKFIEYFSEGGFIMYPLLICSVVVWAVFIEKIWFLSKFKKQYRKLYDKALKLLEEGKTTECVGLVKSAESYLKTPFLAVLEGKELEREEWEKNISRKLSETHLVLKRFLWLLGTIGNLAPFIGLFGTVVGIIKSFDSMAKSGKSGFAVVSSGLAEALIATAAGILVAVVAVLFYNYFQSQINSLNLRIKNSLEELVQKVENN